MHFQSHPHRFLVVQSFVKTAVMCGFTPSARWVSSHRREIPMENKLTLIYEPERILYAISDEEINKLCDGEKSLWKDFFLVAISLGLPCIINGISSPVKGSEFPLSAVINYIFGGVGLILAIIFFVLWRSDSKNSDSLLSTIKARQKVQLPSNTSDVGKL